MHSLRTLITGLVEHLREKLQQRAIEFGGIGTRKQCPVYDLVCVNRPPRVFSWNGDLHAFQRTIRPALAHDQ
jgi:hypothetical protein